MTHAEPSEAAGPGTAYVDGAFVALADARVSVLDRGVLFADSVYEVVPVYAGRPFKLEAHLDRLAASLGALRIPDPRDRDSWRALARELIEANGGGDLALYVQVTRGTAPRRDHRLPDHPQPTIIAFCQTRHPPAPEVLRDGVAVITAADERWRHCAIKSTSLLANVLSADTARARGAVEALMVRDGAVLEGASSNVFAVIDGRLVTPALRETILAGITRGLVLELAAAKGVDYAEIERLTPEALRAADEVWITSSTREALPVTRVDDAAIGDGRPGPLWTRMHGWLHAVSYE